MPVGHLLRKTGAHLRLSIAALERGRGTSLVPAEGITRVIYQLKIDSVRSVAEEPNQPAATPPSVTGRTGARFALAADAIDLSHGRGER